MKRIWLLLLLTLFVASGYGEQIKIDAGLWNYGSINIINSDVKLNLDISKSAQAVNINAYNFSGGVQFRNDGKRNGVLLRGKYLLDLPLIEKGQKTISSESSLAMGFLFANYVFSAAGDYERFPHNQYLLGLGEYIKMQTETSSSYAMVKIGGKGTAAILFDDYGTTGLELDNYELGAHGLVQSRVSDSVVLHFSADAARKKYNPERYFFTEDWATDINLKSAIVVSASKRLELIPSFNYRRLDIERDIRNRPDLERPEFGAAAVVKNVFSGVNATLKGSYAPWKHKQGRETLIALAVESKKINAEMYHRAIKDIYSSFSQEEKITGVQLSWGFGGSEKDKIKSIDDYGNVIKDKYYFYRNSGIEDDTRLTREQQAERLGTIRKRNEWSGKNLKYLSALEYGGWGFRESDEVYNLRGGDCDEQACLNNSLDVMNGYRAYLLDYYDLLAWQGHGVELVQDPRNGQWYLDEYGVIYKVNVDPNASLETVALEALKQNHRNLALQLKNYKIIDYTGLEKTETYAYYEVYDCHAPGFYDGVTAFLKIDSVPSKENRPQIEYGYELFTGRDMLFK